MRWAKWCAAVAVAERTGVPFAVWFPVLAVIAAAWGVVGSVLATRVERRRRRERLERLRRMGVRL